MFEFFLAQNKPSNSLSSLPDDILLRIFSEFSPVQWVTDQQECGRWPHNPVQLYNSELDADSIAYLPTKRALSLVSWRFNGLTKRLLYEFIAVLTIKQLQTLDQSIRRLPTVAVNLARYTKRLDIVPTGAPRYRERRFRVHHTNVPRGEQLFLYAMRIWTACPRITHLAVSIMYEHIPGPTLLTKSIRDSCPELKVINWRSGPVFDHIDLLPDFASKLCILDISKSACLRYFEDEPDEIKPLQFPHLHTLRGPVTAICRDFSVFDLPALHTFIAEHFDRDVCLQQDLDAFFQKHGPNLKQLVSFASGLNISLKHLANLRSLTFRIGDDIMSKPEERQYNTALQYIGLLDYPDLGYEVFSSSSSASDALRRTALEKLISTNKHIVAAKQVDFPNLCMVQILSSLANVDSARILSSYSTTWDPVNSGIIFTDYTGRDITRLPKSLDTKAHPVTPKAKNMQSRRVSPRVRRHPKVKFAKEYPPPTVGELMATTTDIANDETNPAEDTFSKKFDFSLNLNP